MFQNGNIHTLWLTGQEEGLMKWSDQSGTDILRQMECIQGLAVLSFEVKQSGQWTGKNVFLSYRSQVDVLKKLTFAVLQQNQNEH